MSAVADFIARNILLVLGVAVSCSLALTYALWILIEKHGPRSWRLLVRVWEALRASAPISAVRKTRLIGPLYSRSMTVARYLGVAAPCGLAFAVLSTLAFFELADEIGVTDSLARFDLELTAALQKHVSRDVLQAFAMVTRLGDLQFLVIVGLVVFVGLCARRLWFLAGAWAVATVGGALLNRILKSIFERTRPVHDHGALVETGWSFPSGHASGSMLVYGLLAYILIRRTRRALHFPITLLFVAVVLVVGSSRIVLQVHYLSDVLAGYMSAAAWVAASIAILETVRWRTQLGNRNALLAGSKTGRL